MSVDIVPELRREAYYQPTFRMGPFGFPQKGFELTRTNLLAADEIDRLRAEGDQLRYERDEARKTICWDACISRGEPTLEAAKLEAARRKWDCFGEVK